MIGNRQSCELGGTMKDHDSYLLSCIHYIASAFADINVSYSIVDSAALWVQGVKVEEPFPLKVQFQWDGLEEVFHKFQDHKPSPVKKEVDKASFYFQWNGIDVQLECLFNITVRTNPYRIKIENEGVELWCLSLYTHLYSETSDLHKQAIHEFLLYKQHSITSNNEGAWNQNQYNALVNRYGNPNELAEKIEKNPEWRLFPFLKYLGDVNEKKIAHLMGSNGIKAVALSKLGAEVTVVDFSLENKKYANEVASAANVSINYIVQDILSLSKRKEFLDSYDFVLMELGVLHYLIDLHPLFETVSNLLSKGGRFCLHEFHPVSTKLITSSGKKHKVTGNYFDPTIEENQVAFSKHLDSEQKQELMTVLQRKWTLGEVVTSVAQSGLIVEILEEEPNHKAHDIGLPKTYTLIARK